VYLELRITAEYGDKEKFIEKLKDEIGLNAVEIVTAVEQTVLGAEASAVATMVVAAEQIQNKIINLYFLEGRDTIVVHVATRTLPQAKQQAQRVARRICAMFENPAVKTRTKAVVYVTNFQASDTAVIMGERVSRRGRFVNALTERWVARIVTPIVVFVVAAVFLPGSSLFLSAFIGLIAAVVTLLAEGLQATSTAADWEWKEIQHEE
jgi:hypothetical protein